ncbi:MAG TPA: hypothetical protein VKH35_05855 [Thermoanaerobaculia bacterium]|nr:hypothetical protein [Thermoanaerobaculia bacterium]
MTYRTSFWPSAIACQNDCRESWSRDLRRDRELAFYGAEDLTPSTFYSKKDATLARDGAARTVTLVRPHVLGTK